MNQHAAAGLERMLQISRDLLALAESGDARAVADLDAERLRLLHSIAPVSGNLDAATRRALQAITELNDKALGLLEHRRRRTEREMDMVATGRRALLAYSSNRHER